MKIGFDARLYGQYHRGIGKYTELLLDELYKKLPPNTLVIFGSSNLKQKYTKAKIINVDIKAYSFKEQLLFSRILKKEQCELYHFPHFNVPIFFNKPFVVTIHDLIIHEFPDSRATTLPWPVYKIKLWLYYIVVKKVLERALWIICVSETTKQVLIERYPKTSPKTIVVLEAPTLQARGESARLVQGLYFLYVGAAYPHKNLRLLLGAFSKAQNSRGVKLVLVGREDFFYNRLKAEMGDISNVLFYGEATTDELVSLYDNCLCYVSPALQEGFNLNALDALVFDKPIILSDIKINKEIFGDCGHYFKPYEEGQLTTLLEQYILGLTHESGLTDKAKILLNQYQWSKSADVVINLYQQLLSLG